MPETKLQDFIYTLIMAFVMVYVMICYNIAIHTGGLNNFVFLEAFNGLIYMWPIAIILEFFLIGKIAHKLTFKALDPKKTPSIIISYGISIVIVTFMCPIMSLVATILINKPSLDIFISSWLQSMVLSFPMAMCFQLFYAGPIVRFIFNLLKNKLRNIRNKINFISPLSLPPRFPTSQIRYPLFSIGLNSDSRYRTRVLFILIKLYFI